MTVNRTDSRGFILPVTLVMLLTSGILLVALLGYVSATNRISGMFMSRTVCRLAAQSAIEDAKITIHRRFYTYCGTSTVKIGLMSGSAFNWFTTYTKTSIGIQKNSILPVTLPATTNINGCVVRPRIAGVIRPGNAAYATVVFRATATRPTGSGQTASATIEETVRYGLGPSPVFDYAYFVNNYGWFFGGGVIANGDVRANGDMALYGGSSTAQSTINGRVYAAANTELNASGTIKGTGKKQDRDTYWGSCGNSARPTSPTCLLTLDDGTQVDGPTWSGGYNYKESITDRLVDSSGEESGVLNMPFIGNLADYVDYAKNEGGTIKQGGATRVNAYYDGVGPSGDATLADKGAIILVGTETAPIVVDGPVVVASDVLISGYITGQGTIYSGRNIHILDNVTYVNPPSWPHPDSNPTNALRKNASKDLVGLAAKGNIVIGDYSDSEWKNSVLGAVQTRAYTCDASDSSIGYPTAFNGEYSNADGGYRVTTKTVTQWNTDGSYTRVTKQANTKDRCYYQSVVDPKTITQYASETYWSSYYRQYVTSTKRITRIDGVLYDNHAIMGYLGNAVINGSIVCRDEALIYNGAFHINWDIRLGSASAEGSGFSTYLPVDDTAPTPIAWREVPDSLNQD